MRYRFELSSQEGKNWIHLLLEHSRTTPYFLLLDSNQHKDPFGNYEWLMAIDAHKVFTPTSQRPFQELKEFHHQTKDWLFGHINYDLKNQLEKLSSNNPDHLEFGYLEFFVPKTLVYAQNGSIHVESYIYSNPQELLKDTVQHKVSEPGLVDQIQLKASTQRSAYLNTISSIKEELQFGNIYEINYCIEFGAHTPLDPLSIFKNLNKLSKAPFAAFYKNQNQYLACASPERYLNKQGNTLISQPIKGTAKRSSDPEEDAQLKRNLRDDEKERAENVMITDLVRNDLSRTAQKASVTVEELFGVYSYPGVHQMVSTVRANLDTDKFHFADTLETSFPMGSMTGAPKIKAMELIDTFENFSRSLYSGSVGYIDPNGNFDFNVVIRSIFHNANTGYTSVRVGSAITIHCQAEKEYDECLLKAEKLFKVLQQNFAIPNA